MPTSKDILYSLGKNDECMTPMYAIEPIIPYIMEGAIVWCPFDKRFSNFVSLISDTNPVEFSHIDDPDGGDFYSYEPDKWDVMISNPPFTNKRKIFERALSFGKPMALLMSNTWLNDSGSKKVFRDAGRNMELMMFDNRIQFDNQKKITFSSSYYCSNFLPKDIVLHGKLEVPK